MMNALDSIIAAQKNGQAIGIPSVCSAHPFVLEATLLNGVAHEAAVLIEATCNQVNQFGGYTGMRPADFVRSVREMAERAGLSQEKLILGGDHLGPLVWSSEPAASAMQKARTLVSEYARAGFSKIHLDCSMPCADDRELPVEIVAGRAAELAAVAEAAAGDSRVALRYVIGSEVPTAGGARAGEHHLAVTDPADAAETIALTHAAFSARGLDAAWERVIALVVQPGVEFGEDTIDEYDRQAAAGLARFIETVPGMVYEAHSTDYQTRTALRSLVEDHFGILKVGPALTFAFREAVFGLADIEEILLESDHSHIRQVLEARMQANPAHWQKHYRGSPRQQAIARQYSFSDRIRYYWQDAPVQAAFEQLLRNLGDRSLPLSLLSQYLPRQMTKIRQGELLNHPRALLLDAVSVVLDDYAFASSSV